MKMLIRVLLLILISLITFGLTYKSNGFKCPSEKNTIEVLDSGVYSIHTNQKDSVYIYYYKKVN